MPNDYAKALGAKLRAVRNQQGLSLQAVEARSDGEWKAVVVGSYERGDRAVTVSRLASLADFYGVPTAELLPEPATAAIVSAPPRLVLDLEQLATAPADEVAPLARFVASIQAQRGDYNGRVLTIRSDDLRTLAVIYDEAPGPLADRMIAWGVLNPEARPAVPS